MDDKDHMVKLHYLWLLIDFRVSGRISRVQQPRSRVRQGRRPGVQGPGHPRSPTHRKPTKPDHQ